MLNPSFDHGTMAQYGTFLGIKNRPKTKKKRIQLQAVTSKESVQWKSLALTGWGRRCGFWVTLGDLEPPRISSSCIKTWIFSGL